MRRTEQEMLADTEQVRTCADYLTDRPQVAQRISGAWDATLTALLRRLLMLEGYSAEQAALAWVQVNGVRAASRARRLQDRL